MTKAYLIFFLLVYDCQLFKKHCLYEISTFGAEVVMVQSGKYLPCNHEDLSSIPSSHVKSQVWQEMLVTPALGGRCRGPWHLLDCQSQWSIPDTVKACFKNVVEGNRGGWSISTVGFHMHGNGLCVCTPMHTHEHSHIHTTWTFFLKG